MKKSISTAVLTSALGAPAAPALLQPPKAKEFVFKAPAGAEKLFSSKVGNVDEQERSGGERTKNIIGVLAKLEKLEKLTKVRYLALLTE